MGAKVKLSKVQLEVIRLMKEGWELGRDAGFRTTGRSWWIQKGGLGRGGEYKSISSATGHKLYKLGLIYRPNLNVEFPTEHWALTEEGKTIE